MLHTAWKSSSPWIPFILLFSDGSLILGCSLAWSSLRNSTVPLIPLCLWAWRKDGYHPHLAASPFRSSMNYLSSDGVAHPHSYIVCWFQNPLSPWFWPLGLWPASILTCGYFDRHNELASGFPKSFSSRNPVSSILSIPLLYSSSPASLRTPVIQFDALLPVTTAPPFPNFFLSYLSSDNPVTPLAAPVPWACCLRPVPHPRLCLIPYSAWVLHCVIPAMPLR